MVLVLKQYPNGSDGSAALAEDGSAEAATAAVDMASTSRRERGMAAPASGPDNLSRMAPSWLLNRLEPADAVGDRHFGRQALDAGGAEKADDALRVLEHVGRIVRLGDRPAV